MENSFEYLTITEQVTPSSANNSNNSKEHDNRPSTQNDLDYLSVELKVLILKSLPDISSLSALVRSSPLFHGAYAAQRQLILSTVLFREMKDIAPEIIVEAFALYEASKLPWINPQERRSTVEDFFTQYQTKVQQVTIPNFDNIDLETLEVLASHQLMVGKIASLFCESRLSFHPVTCEKVETYKPLSRIEKARVYRALYRFELFYASFHSKYRDDDPFDSQDMAYSLLHVYPAWEVEEMVCIRDYMIEIYSTMLDQCKDEIVEIHRRAEIKEGTHAGVSMDTIEKYCTTKSKMESGLIEDIRDNCTSNGLAYFKNLIDNESTEYRAKILEKAVRTWGFTSKFTNAVEQEPYDSVYVTDLYDAYSNGEELVFECDDLKKPNAAWPWSNDYKIELDYADFRNKSLRKWAYVMWDIDRLERWGVFELDVREMREKVYDSVDN